MTGSALAVDPPAPPEISGNDAAPVSQAPAAAPAEPPAAAAKPAPVAAANSTSGPADAESDLAQLEKRMHAMGYATVMRNGERVFCRRDEVLGTRLATTYHCLTPNEARTNRQQQDFDVLRQHLMPGCLQGGAFKPANCGG
jgi:hypothetical protein